MPHKLGNILLPIELGSISSAQLTGHNEQLLSPWMVVGDDVVQPITVEEEPSTCLSPSPKFQSVKGNTYIPIPRQLYTAHRCHILAKRSTSRRAFCMQRLAKLSRP